MKYVELSDVRGWLDLAEDVIADDDELEAVVNAVEAELEENVFFRTFVAPGSSSARVYDAGSKVLFVDDAPSFSLVEESNDETTWTTITDWRSGPRNEPVQYELHRTTGRFAPYVRVTAPWGYTGGPPAKLIQAIKVRSAALLDRRNSANGIAGEGQFGVSRVSRYDDPDVERLTRSLVRHDRAVLVR